MNYCQPYFTKINEGNQHAMISKFDTEVENLMRTYPKTKLLLKLILTLVISLEADTIWQKLICSLHILNMIFPI